MGKRDTRRKEKANQALHARRETTCTQGDFHAQSFCVRRKPQISIHVGRICIGKGHYLIISMYNCTHRHKIPRVGKLFCGIILLYVRSVCVIEKISTRRIILRAQENKVAANFICVTQHTVYIGVILGMFTRKKDSLCAQHHPTQKYAQVRRENKMRRNTSTCRKPKSRLGVSILIMICMIVE